VASQRLALNPAGVSLIIFLNAKKSNLQVHNIFPKLIFQAIKKFAQYVVLGCVLEALLAILDVLTLLAV
jgi:hypothetical protein